MSSQNYNIEIEKISNKPRFNLQLDTTLSKRGYAADAYSVGLAIANVPTQLTDHRLLVGRNAENQHPISAISNLDNVLDTKVDKEEGKGLSTNDFTDQDKTKLDSIAAGAEVNVNADWSQTNTSADDYIKNKPPITQSNDDWVFDNGADGITISTSFASIVFGGNSAALEITTNNDWDIAISGGNGLSLSSGTDEIDVNSNVITNLGTPITATDAANKDYVDSALANKMDKANPTGTGALSVNRKANTIIGTNSVAVGHDCTASGTYSHAEGMATTAKGTYSHTEGFNSVAEGNASHAEGRSVVNEDAACAHAEGRSTVQPGADSAHAEGIGTIASGEAQHAAGKYNVEDASALRVTGNGVNVSNRKNAEKLDANGNYILKGSLTLGANDDSTGGVTITATQLQQLLALLGN